MEGLAAAGGVIAVVSLAAQVLEGCSYLKDIFDKADTAPREIRLIANELAIIQSIVRSTPNSDEHQDELDFCQERLSKLRKIIDKYGDLDGTKRRRQWGKRLGMALNVDKIEKHVVHLREARRYLERIQNLSAHDQTLVKTHQVHESVQLLSTSHSELARITSRSEGKLHEIEGITRQTQNAIHELADRFVHRERGKMVEHECNVQRLIVALEAKLRDQLSEHKSNSPRPGQALDASCRLDDSSQHVPIPQIDSKVGQVYPPEHGDKAFTPNSYFDTNHGSDSGDLPFTEKTSKFRNNLGQVIFRTVSAYHSSSNEMPIALLPIMTANSHPQFPITITTTEILLIPRQWAAARFASIMCRNIMSSTSNISDINIQINTPVIPPLPKRSSCSVPRSRQDIQNFFDMQPKGHSNPSQLLYIAFRTAFYATTVQSRHSMQNSFHRPVVKTPVARKSFDDEVNDVLEVIQLWINSEFDAHFYKEAFPGDMGQKVQIEKECQAIIKTGSRGLQKLRLDYTFHAVSKLVAQCDKSPNQERVDLDAIHMVYWDQTQLLAMPCPRGIGYDPPVQVEPARKRPPVSKAEWEYIGRLLEITRSLDKPGIPKSLEGRLNDFTLQRPSIYVPFLADGRTNRSVFWSWVIVFVQELWLQFGTHDDFDLIPFLIKFYRCDFNVPVTVDMVDEVLSHLMLLSELLG